MGSYGDVLCHNIPTSRYGFGTRRVVHAVQIHRESLYPSPYCNVSTYLESHVRTHHHLYQWKLWTFETRTFSFAFCRILSCILSHVSSRALEASSLGVRMTSDRDCRAGRTTMGPSDWWLHIPPSSIEEPSLNRRLLRFASYIHYSDEASAYLLPVSNVDAGEGAQRTRRLMSREVIIVVQAVHHSLP